LGRFAAAAAKHFRDAFAAQLNLILARRALLNLDLAKNQKRQEKIMNKNTNKLKKQRARPRNRNRVTTTTKSASSSPAEAAGRPEAWPRGFWPYKKDYTRIIIQ